MKFAFNLYIGRPDYVYFDLCHGRNRYRDEDFIIQHGGNKFLTRISLSIHKWLIRDVVCKTCCCLVMLLLLVRGFSHLQCVMLLCIHTLFIAAAFATPVIWGVQPPPVSCSCAYTHCSLLLVMLPLLFGGYSHLQYVMFLCIHTLFIAAAFATPVIWGEQPSPVCDAPVHTHTVHCCWLCYPCYLGGSATPSVSYSCSLVDRRPPLLWNYPLHSEHLSGYTHTHTHTHTHTSIHSSATFQCL